MATHSSILAWKIPWTEEPAELHEVAKESDTTEQLTQTPVKAGREHQANFLTELTVVRKGLLVIFLTRMLSRYSSTLGCNPQESSVHGISQARTLELPGLPSPPPGHLPSPRDRTHLSFISSISRRVLYH